jgi:hypothetical protein
MDMLRDLIEQAEELAEPSVTASTQEERAWYPEDLVGGGT